MSPHSRTQQLTEHRLFRYLVSGGTGAIIHFSILTGLVAWFDADPLISTTIGFIIGSMVNYMLQYHWTFAADGPHHVMLTRYAVVTTATMLLNGQLFWLLTSQLGMYYLIAQFIVTGIIVTVNFLINKHYTFASPD
jgi:putative flippase GtrA